MPPITEVSHHDINQMLRDGADLVAVRGTGSMRPLIPAGDGIVAYALVERCDYSQLKRDNLVVFSTTKGNVIHQLAQATPQGWITSGSANGAYDAGRVTASNFHSRAVQIYTLSK